MLEQPQEASVFEKKAVLPPNSLLEPRNFYSEVPVLYDNLCFVNFNKAGNCILGTSAITDSFWEGTLFYFQDEKELQKFNHRGAYVFSTSSDGKFLNDKTVVLADDTGHINVLSIDEDMTIRNLNYFKLVERVPQVDVWNNSPLILGCSSRSIYIFDSNSVYGKPLEKYEFYHCGDVTSVDTLKQDSNLFLSGGRDRMACIWDVRNSEVASLLYRNEFSSITSVAWNQEDTNYIVVGTQAGDVYLLDKREPKDFVSVLYCFSAPVNRISFKDASDFAVCGDTNEVLVVNSEASNLDVIYKNEKHKGHVKDLAWYKDALYSCGFKQSLVKHVM